MKYYAPFGEYYLLSLAISVLVVLQSLTARIGFIALAKWLTFTSNSQRMRFILVSVFLIYFLNYGVLYLIAPLNLNLPIVSSILKGIYPDFN